MKDRESYFRHKRAAAIFARSLISEGYRLMLEWSDDKDLISYIKLRHARNKAIIKVVADDTSWFAERNNKVIKEVRL